MTCDLSLVPICTIQGSLGIFIATNGLLMACRHCLVYFGLLAAIKGPSHLAMIQQLKLSRKITILTRRGMEISSSSSSNSPAGVPPYVRLSSEVVEKPEDYEESRMVPEGRMAELSPGSPAASTSSKSDNEGIVQYLLGLAGVGFTVSVCPSVGSEGEMEQGDVDEGFDEEFEDKDLNEAEPINHFQLGDLDPKELQQLLDDPQLPNLEDFDLGVDVLDSEQAHPILSPTGTMRNTGLYSPVPSSPYQSNFSPAPIDSYYNDYNLSESFCSEDPPSVQSNISALSLQAEDLSLAMLTADCNILPDSTSDLSPDTVDTPSGHQSSPQHHPPSPVPPSAGGLDLSEASQLLSADTLIELSTALSSEAIVDTQSMYMFGNGSAHLNLSPNGSQQNSSSVITLLDSVAMFPMNSEPLQTPPSPDRNNFTTPPPRSSFHRAPRQSSKRSASLSPAPSPKSVESKLSEEDKKLIDMPYYQFRKLLDDPSIPERRKEEIKNIRRKGRNKVAAKVCRSKKIHLIMGLEKEVEQLRKAKSQIEMRTMSLEREIEELKKKCHNR